LFCVVVIAGVAFTVRLATLLRSGDTWAFFTGDSREYVELAQGIRAGCGFTHLINGRCGVPEVLRTPGYPLFVAAMPNLRWAIAAQALISGGVCLAVGLIGLRLWGTKAALIGQLIFACDVPSIVSSGTIMSDSLFGAFLASGILLQMYVLVRGRLDRTGIGLLFLAILLLGGALMVRPIGIILPLLAPVPFLFMSHVRLRRRFAFALVAFCIPATLMTAWIIRNGKETGIWTLSTAGAFQLYYYRAAGVVWYRTGENILELHGRFAHDVGLTNATYYLPPSVYNQMIHNALEIMGADPVATVVMTLRCFVWVAVVPDRVNLSEFLGLKAGAAQTFHPASGDMLVRLDNLFHSPVLTVLIGFQIIPVFFTWIGVMLAVWGLRNRSWHEAAYVLYPLMIALFLILLAAGPDGVARHRMPAMPLLAMLAGVGWSAVRTAPQRRSRGFT
jgi:4-amino-4-deoxy-L-arabinose transferase-like glycosyltransferase